MLLLEFCIGGSLDSFLLDTARGLRYLHKNQCIHRDIASRNCLIAKDVAEKPEMCKEKPTGIDQDLRLWYEQTS